MLVELERQPVLEVLPEGVEAAARQMREAGLPAFVVRAAAEGRKQVHDGLFNAGYYLDYSSQLSFTRDEHSPEFTRRDRPFHFDRSRDPNEVASVISTHETTEGVVEAAFLEMVANGVRHGAENMRADLQEHLRLGKVDPDKIVPVMHAAVLGVGDMVVFRLAGTVQLAHRFTTIEFPRQSTTLDWNTDPKRKTFPIKEILLDEIT